MELTCKKNKLKEAITLCEKISGKNLSLPILGNILLTADKDGLKLVATNLEIGLEIKIDAEIKEEGVIAIPSDIINNFISNLSDDENIVLKTQEGNLSVLTSNTSTLIKCQPSEEFPLLPKPTDSGKKYKIPVNDLVLGLKSVWYSASILDIKPEIASIYIYSNEKIPIAFVATDSFRLAEKRFSYSFKGFENILVPSKNVSDILRIFDGKEGDVELISDKNQIFFIKDNVKFVSRLTEGVFPDYKQILPNSFVTDVILNKDLLINTLKTAGVFSGKLRELNFYIGSDPKSITIKSTSVEAGEHIANIQARVTGNELSMSFNHKYIFDCLQYVPSQEVILRFAGEGKPLVITGIDDSSFQYLVMPMNSL
jgi:DNA polymerase-3 subunit beta